MPHEALNLGKEPLEAPEPLTSSAEHRERRALETAIGNVFETAQELAADPSANRDDEPPKGWERTFWMTRGKREQSVLVDVLVGTGDNKDQIAVECVISAIEQVDHPFSYEVRNE